MGAPGLLSVVDNNAPVFSLNSDAAKSLDIVYDIQGLLHRGKSICEVEQIATLQQAGEQVPMRLWSPLVEYVFSKTSHIASCVRSATFVIDGAQLPSKNDEIVQRKRAKAKLFVEAVKLNVTDMVGARKKFSSSIEVSIDSVRNAIIQRLSSANLTIIQAPNEGDAQLAWLLKSNCVDVVFCNDSDLLLYGCERVIVVKSTNDPYTGSEYEISDAFNKTGHLLYNYTHDMLIALALVCGCDFSNGISGISWKKGASLIRDHWNEVTPLDLDALINAAKAMGKVVPSNFIEQFTRGFLTFKHQRVFNSSTNTIQYLSPPTDDISPSSLAETLGEPIADTSISQDIANGILHPLKLKPYAEVLPDEGDDDEEASPERVVESSESRARIINKEMKEFEQEFNALSDIERKALSDEYYQKLLLKDQEMHQKEAIDPSDPDVNLWKKREAAFNKYEQEYQHNIKQHGTGNIDKERVIQWAMLVIKKVEDKHGKGVSGYGLKAMPGKDGTPLRNEDLMYIVDNNRNPTACKIAHIVQAGDSSVAIGRHYKRSECRRYDEESMEDVTGSNQQLIHRFIQYPESILGDCGGYYGELVLTKVLFVVLGNVLNRTYFGTAIDLSGLKDHCFGLSFIINFSELLDNNAMGICTAQSSDVMHHFQHSFTTNFMLVTVAGRDPVNLDNKVKQLASAIRSDDPLPPDMLKLRSELETVYTKKVLDAKVKRIQDGWGTMTEKKAKQGAQKVHQRNVNELGMIEANSEETVIQQCPNCKKEKNTTHIFIEEGGERKIVLDKCFSRSNGLTKRCDHIMKVKPSNKKTPSTISRKAVIKRLKAAAKAAAVVSSSDDPSSSGVDTDTDVSITSVPSDNLPSWSTDTITSLENSGAQVVAIMSGRAGFDRDNQMFYIEGQRSDNQDTPSDSFRLSTACHPFDDMTSPPPDGRYKGSFTRGGNHTQVPDSAKLYIESSGDGRLAITGEGESEMGRYKVLGVMTRRGELAMIHYSENFIGMSKEQRNLALELYSNPHQLSVYEQTVLVEIVNDVLIPSDEINDSLNAIGDNESSGDEVSSEDKIAHIEPANIIHTLRRSDTSSLLVDSPATNSLGDYEPSDEDDGYDTEDDGYDTDDLCQSSTGSDDSDDLSISDESSSSVVDDDNQESRVFIFAPLFSISSESVIDPEAGMRVAMRFNNGLHYSGTIINVHPTHPTEPDVGLTVSIWLDDNTMETYVKYPSDDIRFLRNSSLSIAFDRKLFPLDIEE